jgi:CubicO group peptidase (beta-lactamase class C family)
MDQGQWASNSFVLSATPLALLWQLLASKLCIAGIAPFYKDHLTKKNTRQMARQFLVLFILFSSKFCFGQTDYSKLTDYYKTDKNFNGVVLVATDGKIDYLSGVGIANRQNQTSINSKSRFKIASITKTFTVVLILQLYEQGKIDLNATIGKYLPAYKGDAKEKVTIHNLLTYSSGIPNCEGNTGIGVYQSPISVDNFIDKYCSGKLVFEPGKQFSYDNGNYIILGRIIEKITGKSFTQNLVDDILKPLKMESTDLLYNKNIVNGLVETYNIDDSTKVFYKDDPMYIENYYSAGAMYSTVEDLLKFDTGIFQYKLLNKKTVDLMLTPYPELYGVAYGFWVTDNKFGDQTFKVANRQGSIWGANANWLHLIDNNKTFIVFSNTNATDLQELTAQLVLVSTEQKIVVPSYANIATKKTDLSTIKGTWILDLRPDPTSEPYYKDFIIEPTKGKFFNGEFYGTKLKGGYFNTDWENIYFAFTTSDKDNTYVHSGYIVGNKIFGISYSQDRKFISHWTGVKK